MLPFPHSPNLPLDPLFLFSQYPQTRCPWRLIDLLIRNRNNTWFNGDE